MIFQCLSCWRAQAARGCSGLENCRTDCPEKSGCGTHSCLAHQIGATAVCAGCMGFSTLTAWVSFILPRPESIGSKKLLQNKFGLKIMEAPSACPAKKSSSTRRGVNELCKSHNSTSDSRSSELGGRTMAGQFSPATCRPQSHRYSCHLSWHFIFVCLLQPSIWL